MATGAFAASTVLMALVLAVVFVVVWRAQAVRAYSHSLGARARELTEGRSAQGGVRVDPKLLLAFLAVVGFVAAAVVFGQDPMVFVAAVVALVFAYFSWGVYYLGRSHGMGTAHAVGLCAWFASLVAVFAIATKLLVG
jgi:heme/copper-type cytochrome/quinol oxidase subunit 2